MRANAGLVVEPEVLTIRFRIGKNENVWWNRTAAISAELRRYVVTRWPQTGLVPIEQELNHRFAIAFQNFRIVSLRQRGLRQPPNVFDCVLHTYPLDGNPLSRSWQSCRIV